MNECGTIVSMAKSLFSSLDISSIIARCNFSPKYDWHNKDKMAQRSKREMEALAAKLKEQIGPVEKWSNDALVSLTRWLADYHMTLSQELVKRGDGSSIGEILPDGNIPEKSSPKNKNRVSAVKKSEELFAGGES
jgi:hypothetical protein